MALRKNLFLNTWKYQKVFCEAVFFQVYSTPLEQDKNKPGKIEYNIKRWAWQSTEMRKTSERKSDG